MRPSIAMIAGTVCLTFPAAAEPTSIVIPLDNPAYSDPTKKWTSVDEAVADFEADDDWQSALERLRNLRDCRDVITKVRSEAGLPLLDRQPASPDKPYLIYAVDRREGGCSVMVMKGNPDDIRQLPKPMEGPVGVIPAEAAGD